MQDKNWLKMWIPKLDPTLPKAEALKLAIRHAVECGELRANDRLPPQRQLAYQLGVNLSTVTRAISDATRDGLVSGEVGRGTYVLPTADAARLFADTLADKALIDLSAIVPPKIDETAIASTMHEVLEDGEFLHRYPTPLHLRYARDAARDWLRWRGFDRPDLNLTLTAGAHAALYSIMSMTLKSGQGVLTEEYTFPGIKAISRLTGLRLHGVPCDREGLLPDALEQVSRACGATTLVTVPNMQNPTATVMGNARRQDIAAVVSRLALTVIEDDVYGSYTGMPPLVADLAGNHIVISSLSKCVSPALRFGFVAGTHPMIAFLQQNVASTSWFASPVLLLTGARLIFKNKAMRIAQAQKRLIRDRWQIVRRSFPDASDRPATHLWIPVDNADSFVQRALDRGVSVVSSDHFSTGRRDQQFVRISTTSVAEERLLAIGLNILTDL
jgi:DNA-binding transcriptional MocR family regulator